MRAAIGAVSACKRLPLNESLDLSVEARLTLGDTEAVHDFVRDAAEELSELADQIAEQLCDEPEVIARLWAVRRRQEQTARSWYGEGTSGPIKDAAATDRGGKELRGAERGQEKPRRAKGGRPAKKARRRC